MHALLSQLIVGTFPPLDLAQLRDQSELDGPLWSYTTDQLNLNLLRFRFGDGIPNHQNHEVDVLLIVLEGTAILEIDLVQQPIGVGSIVCVPRGAARSIQATSDELIYFSCHQRRAGLFPTITKHNAM
ncbi:MAG TPA: cupin domain-containing protein [Herpetosiphon sp.]|uniref:Cupin 2 conserved barrel domain protein n=2 Tax=Herpetosiphon TaxID=64 RepID=A9B1R1_HERA2|nr:cupin domain-containing protein [Herpetosiphon sp.]ABX03946.1 Cupin 2 conserved barrel domain protein [Herpetosiphon aurantiacus DSM 785]MCA0351021.1 cupin domain-containing protein [Chloroflexota bacterium]HBW51054.1 cupin domain-containing protein [Herpetosiphon sp.]